MAKNAEGPSDTDADALIGRTEALLKKHRPRNNPNFAGSPAPSLDIPVLTEVVDAQTAPAPATPAPQPDLDELAQRLHQEVLRGLQPQIESLIDARLAHTLGALLEQVRHGMEAELKLSLRAMVRDAVAAAADRELLRVTAPQSTPSPVSVPAPQPVAQAAAKVAAQPAAKAAPPEAAKPAAPAAAAAKPAPTATANPSPTPAATTAPKPPPAPKR